MEELISVIVPVYKVENIYINVLILLSIRHIKI